MNLVPEVCGANPLEFQPEKCPVCDKPGKKVRFETLQNIIKEERIPASFENYYLCLSNKCDVIYFGQQIYYKDDVKVKVWFKEDDFSAPVCYCQNVTAADIIKHIATRGCCKNLHDIQEHTGANTGKDCLTKNPAGT